MKKILIIDDAAETRNSIRRTLEWNGFAVAQAGNGIEALDVLKNTDVDVIITDVFMPEMEGIETIRHLRAEHPEVPIIVMTGALNEVYVHIGVKLGAVCGLSKPFSTEELLTAIDTAIDNVDKLRLAAQS